MAERPHTYTHGHDSTVLAAHAGRTAANSAAYLLAALRPGLNLLDVGCGAGTITRDLARLVAPGRVVGVDSDPGVIEAAQASVAGEPGAAGGEVGEPGVAGGEVGEPGAVVGSVGGAENLEFVLGDVYCLGFADGSFDVAHAHQVLQHLADPPAALREMARVVRPGGVIAARDGDYGGAFWYPASEAWSEWQRVYLAVARAGGSELAAGRRLRTWALAAGFAPGQVTVSGSVWTYPGFEPAAVIAASWAARLTGQHFGALAERHGVATKESLAATAAGLAAWAEHPDAFFAMPHGEVLIRVV